MSVPGWTARVATVVAAISAAAGGYLVTATEADAGEPGAVLATIRGVYVADRGAGQEPCVSRPVLPVSGLLGGPPKTARLTLPDCDGLGVDLAVAYRFRAAPTGGAPVLAMVVTLVGKEGGPVAEDVQQYTVVMDGNGYDTSVAVRPAGRWATAQLVTTREWAGG